jgi:uncharacterized protein (DUF1810 family)
MVDATDFLVGEKVGEKIKELLEEVEKINYNKKRYIYMASDGPMKKFHAVINPGGKIHKFPIIGFKAALKEIKKGQKINDWIWWYIPTPLSSRKVSKMNSEFSLKEYEDNGDDDVILFIKDTTLFTNYIRMVRAIKDQLRNSNHTVMGKNLDLKKFYWSVDYFLKKIDHMILMNTGPAEKKMFTYFKDELNEAKENAINSYSVLKNGGDIPIFLQASKSPSRTSGPSGPSRTSNSSSPRKTSGTPSSPSGQSSSESDILLFKCNGTSSTRESSPIKSSPIKSSPIKNSPSSPIRTSNNNQSSQRRTSKQRSSRRTNTNTSNENSYYVEPPKGSFKRCYNLKKSKNDGWCAKYIEPC